MPILPRSRYFPPAELGDADGLLLIGGRMTVDRLLDAYRHGIFPWPFTDDPERVAWWSPDPRAVIDLDRFHVSRRLARTVRSGQFETTVNRAFAEVVAGCATTGARLKATWITPALAAAYDELHRAGWAHSVEVWQAGALVGGVYGVAINGVFCGESMFHRERDASKVALVQLVARLRTRGFQLFDIQQLTPHTAQFGAYEIPRRTYLKRLSASLALSAQFAAAAE
jgi:leucyl/phenylalanyl-tRNA--protein transferase